MGSKSFEKRVALVDEIHYGARTGSHGGQFHVRTAPSQPTPPISRSACTEAVSLRRSHAHFEVGLCELRLNEFMTVRRRGGNGGSLRREQCGEVLACRRLTAKWRSREKTSAPTSLPWLPAVWEPTDWITKYLYHGLVSNNYTYSAMYTELKTNTSTLDFHRCQQQVNGCA